MMFIIIIIIPSFEALRVRRRIAIVKLQRFFFVLAWNRENFKIIVNIFNWHVLFAFIIRWKERKKL